MDKPFSKQELIDLVKEVMGIQTITPMINKQINRFILQDKMTYKEIARCVVWYTEVQGKSFTTMYGLGIIPNIREDVEKYFKQLELDQQQKANEAKKIIENQDNNIIFNIKSLKQKPRKRKSLNIGEIKVDPIEGDNSGNNS